MSSFTIVMWLIGTLLIAINVDKKYQGLSVGMCLVVGSLISAIMYKGL